MFRFLIFSFLLMVCASAQSQKTITLRVTPDNQFYLDGITVYKDKLAKELQQRLWRSYMSNGKMATTIFVKNDTESKEIQPEIVAAIREAQEKTLIVLSLHKHKKRFEDISTQKQEKIKKQFPVLFQEKFESSPLVDQH